MHAEHLEVMVALYFIAAGVFKIAGDLFYSVMLSCMAILNLVLLITVLIHDLHGV